MLSKDAELARFIYVFDDAVGIADLRRHERGRCRCVLVQPLVRAHRVEFCAECIEGLLLRGTGPPDRADRLALERAVHPLVRGVLLWPSGMNALMLNAKAHPPDIEI